MKPDEFEQRLQSQPRRAIPSEWRDEILKAAEAAPRAQTSGATRHATRIHGWREWLWPCPQAWAGLVAVWMVLVALHLTESSAPSSAASQSPDSEKQMALAAQRRELARLLDVPTDSPPPPKATVPGPRGENASPSKV